MFILLFCLLLNMQSTFSTIILQSAGVYDIKNDDIAMIFYLTVENSFDHEIHVSVHFVKCMEADSYSEGGDHMFLLGGDMGYMPSKSIRNLTLIYPNLFLRQRSGTCLVSLRFETDQTVEEMRKEIRFNTDQCFQSEEPQEQKCSDDDCAAAFDCVVKYSSRRSYFNRERKQCQVVPECPPNSVYIPKSNTCRKLHTPVCKSDLEMIESGYFEKCHSVTNLVNYRCHHGTRGNNTGECICDQGWITSICSEGVYHPTLNLYHMCNIELNTWGRANRQKLLMTILVIAILALLIAAKMLIAVCLLNWCCHFIKSRRREESDQEFCGAYDCPFNTNNYCGDETCPAGIEENKSSRTIRVSFSTIEGVSSAGESDVTVSVDDGRDDSVSVDKSRSTMSVCHCANK